jgi:hypothetical protein
MLGERHKRSTLEPLYQVAKTLLPTLGISQQNRNYYASLVDYYSIYDLRRQSRGQSYLYLLCYIGLRYRQINDVLLDALVVLTRKVEERTKQASQAQLLEAQAREQRDAPRVGEVLLVIADDNRPASG